jgi:DNA-binding LacI/PurR family transcriptional regulator
MKTVTAKDVAALAGVSRSAVSRAFSDTASVAPETRRRVLEAADRIGYRPNALASNLARKRSDLVAVIANARPDLREPYLFQALHAALQAMRRQLITVAIAHDDDGRLSLPRLIRFPIETAIVLADSVVAAHVAPFCETGRPILLNQRLEGASEADCVVLDELSGTRDALADLAARGCARVWYVAGRRTATAWSSRRAAFLEALALSGMRLADEETGDFSYESGDAAFRRLLARGALADVVVAANDAMAMGALDAARSHLSPADFARFRVTGFDNIPQSGWAPYRFPTIEQSIDETVAHVCDILARRAENPDGPPITRRVQTRYLRRERQPGAAHPL